MPATYITDEEGDTSKRRVTLCPEEWGDDFGDEFYEHAVENGFYYITPNSEWHTNNASIPAPGMAQYHIPSADELQMRIDYLEKGSGING